MAKLSLTPSQQAAVDAPIMDLLVSAAAGSGKTAVLTRRILRLLSDPAEKADISRMLIVTFTKASASELRARIGKAIKEELAYWRALGEEEQNEEAFARCERLSSQLAKLELAQISTIHSFCYALIRKHFSALSLPASLRIADEVESELLMMRTMEETVDALYEEDCSFASFAENLIELRDDKLSATLLDFYKKFASTPEGIPLVKTCAASLQGAVADFNASPYAEAIRRVCRRFTAYYRTAFESALTLLAADEKAKKVYYPAFDADYRYLQEFSALETQDFFETATRLNRYIPGKLSAYRGNKPKEMEDAVSMRKGFLTELKALQKRFFAFSAEDVTRDAAACAAYTDTLYRVLAAFDARYAEEKLRYGILDYNDLEAMAYRLLVQDGKPTELALSVADQYDALFIDEYQDTNAVQDAIFAAISRGNRFMVGDIKQSIYGFRGAMPEIFSHYRAAFPAYEAGKKQASATIFLSENFRSDRAVIDYSNAVFEILFHNNSGRVPYLKADALTCTRKDGEDSSLPVRFLLADRDGVDEHNEAIREETVVAREILSLIESGVKPSDIVILLRNMTAAERFRRALSELSVACQSGKNEDSLFDYPEVMLLIALLNVIDNPTRDIYLAAVLKSPLFGLSLGELIVLRRLYPGTTLYHSLVDFSASEAETENPDALYLTQEKTKEKVETFLSFLSRARRYAELKGSDKVVRYLLKVTPLRAVTVKNTGSGEKLSLFYEFARAYEASRFQGVHGLVRRINDIAADKAAMPPVFREAVDLSAVRIMTIHQAKGCEFDYVFLSDTAHRFNTRDQSAPLVFEKSLGIGLKMRENDGFVRYDTLIRRAIAAKVDENAIDEEMRILYVALTRAKKQLIVTAAKGGNRQTSCDEFLAGLRLRASLIHPQLFAEASSYAEWLLLALPDQKVEVVRELLPPEKRTRQRELPIARSEQAPDKKLLEARLAFVYPYRDRIRLPAKLSVSRLYPGILDDEAEELIRSDKADFERLPTFMQDKLSASGAERGTATHLFMQFCNFERVVQSGVDAEIDRLVADAFLTRGIADLIYRDKLKRFFQSKLFERIRLAKEVRREERFNVKMNASEFTLDPQKAEAYANETILVQGVIDCLILEEDGGILLVDYKTDQTPSDRRVAESLLRKRYTTQLSYYRRAVEILYHTKVKKTLLYAFSLDDVVEIR